MSRPPEAPRNHHVARYHDEEIEDPYFWMRERDLPQVTEYLEAENAYTEETTRHTAALKQQLYDEMLARIKETDLSVPRRIGEYHYYHRTEKGQQYRFHCRKHGSLDDAEELLLDENALAGGHAYCRLGAFEVSPNHELLAYSVDFRGDEKYTIHVKDLKTGELLAESIPGTHSSVEWANDDRTLFYVTVDDAHRPYRLHRHRLGTDPADDPVVYEENDKRFYLSLYKSRSKRFVFVELGSNTTTEVRYLDAGTPAGALRIVEPRRQDVEYSVEHHGESFFIVTNEDAVNFKLMEVGVNDPARTHWRELLPHRPAVRVESVEPFARHLVVVERADGLRRLRVFDAATREDHYVEFPEPVYTVGLVGNPEFETNLLRFVYTSLVTPPSVFDYDMDSHERELKKEEEVLGGYDRSRYRTERVWAVAGDGTRIPISLVCRKDVARDGSNPLQLYGYGAYGMSSDPIFASERLSLLDRGFVYAIAHVRGGGDLGRPWYEAGKLLRKKNSFTDFITCAEHLIQQGYTSADRLAIRGGSAGGLLVGAATNMRPELFAVVVAKVPFVDVVNTMMDETLPLTVIEWEEWGNPKDREYYDYIRSYSPYDNVAPRRYPHMLVTSGLNDPRVAYWEPAKWVARLRTCNRGDGIVLLKTNMGAGHGGASGRYDALDELAFEYAFLLDRLGVPG